MAGNTAISREAVQMWRLLEARYDTRPVTAAEVAEAIELAAATNRENRRREVRKLAAELRSNGFRVCADNDGYWKARSDEEYRDYQDAKKRFARFAFVKSAKETRAASELATGQGGLFGDVTPSATAWAKA